MKIGEYVTAEIDGRVVRDALPIPAKAIYQNTYVYVVEDGVLQRRKVDIAWQNGIDAVVSAGVNMGDQLVVTPLGQVPSGTRVQTRQAGSS